jgi:F-type H+-transporting ATPase subunit delta
MTQHEQPDLHPTGDVRAQRVARIYAEALLNAANKQGQADAIQQEFESFLREALPSVPDLEAFLFSGVIGRKQKAEIITKVFEGRTSEIFFNFLQVLNEHERLDLLRPIGAAYRQLRDQQARRVRVQVRTAVELPADQRERLLGQLRQTFQVEPVLQEQVDPDLLGGLIVRVGDWVYDASVRRELETLRSELIARSSHEIQSRRDQFSSN